MNDTQTRLLINPITKTIAPKYRNQKAVYVAKGDHKSVSVIFEMPRYVDGLDLSEDEYIIQIHFVNLSEDGKNYSKGISEAISREIEGDNLSFAWLVDNRATRYAGVVSVSITIEKYASVDGKAEEVYSWSTAPYGNTKVWDSYDNSSSMTEQEYDYLVATVNTLVTLSLQNKLSEAEKNIDDKVTQAKDYIDDKVTTAEKNIDDKVATAQTQLTFYTEKEKLEFNNNAKDALEKITNSVAETERNAQDASGSAHRANDNAALAKSWAVGDTGYREDENTDNAKYYSEETNKQVKLAQRAVEEAQQTVEEAQNLRDDVQTYPPVAEMYARTAKSWAVGNAGIREGEDTDNAKYYSEQIGNHANEAKGYAQKAEQHANDAEDAADLARQHSNASGRYAADSEQFANEAKGYAESNMVKGKASGVNAVRIDDLSPLEHNIEAKADVDTTFKTYGKNISGSKLTDVFNVDWELFKTDEGKTRYKHSLDIPKLTNYTMTVSVIGNGKGYVALEQSVNQGKWERVNGQYIVAGSGKYTARTFVRTPNTEYRMWGDEDGADGITNFQIELGSTATEIEEYKEPIEGAAWVYPTATVIADTPGANIEVAYNRELNKVIAEIYNAIANL